MKRLYLQIYLTVVLSLVLLVLMAGVMWRLSSQVGPGAQAMEMAGRVAEAILPPPDSPAETQRLALERLATRLGADFALYDPHLDLIAHANSNGQGEPLPAPEADWSMRDWSMRWGSWRPDMRGAGWSIHLPDERWLVMRFSRPHAWPGFSWLGFLALIALAVALAAHPVVRRLTRRLERLEASVNALGEGDLSARVKVHGHDEIAQLARSFNRAAARIEALVNSHRMLLANASHELRTPLARIRLGVELLKKQPDPRREAELAHDIAELDELIEEILTSSRLDAGGKLSREDVDVLALAAEECARYDDCALEGDVAWVEGDPRLLRRLIRNLIENARKHGAPPIEVTVRRAPEGVRVRVCDRGRGVPEAERERIFEPFYRSAGAAGNVGAGLGLALVRQIARRHGGEVHALPREGGGTCIEVRLPAKG
jgi:signal transduction histidine kinase